MFVFIHNLAQTASHVGVVDFQSLLCMFVRIATH